MQARSINIVLNLLLRCPILGSTPALLGTEGWLLNNRTCLAVYIMAVCTHTHVHVVQLQTSILVLYWSLWNPTSRPLESPAHQQSHRPTQNYKHNNTMFQSVWWLTYSVDHSTLVGSNTNSHIAPTNSVSKKWHVHPSVYMHIIKCIRKWNINHCFHSLL